METSLDTLSLVLIVSIVTICAGVRIAAFMATESMKGRMSNLAGAALWAMARMGQRGKSGNTLRATVRSRADALAGQKRVVSRRDRR